jgi:hypothetical protein
LPAQRLGVFRQPGLGDPAVGHPKKAITCQATARPVAATPSHGPRWVPLQVIRAATVSPSPIIWSIATWMSGKAEK